MQSIGLGLRAQKGGAVVVGVIVCQGEPSVTLSIFLATHTAGDPSSFEPYRIAYDIVHGPKGGTPDEAAAAVAEGRRRQERLAEAGLRTILRELENGGHTPVAAALLVNRAGWLVNRAGWIADLLEHALGWPDHVPVAEGLAVRQALRSALHQCGSETVELDEKSLADLAVERLGLSPAAIDTRLKALGTTVGKPWRKEQKLACLAGWIAMAGSR